MEQGQGTRLVERTQGRSAQVEEGLAKNCGGIYG